jgi:hypothetical protein
MAIDWSDSFRRGINEALDISYVFDSVAELQAYLSSASYLSPPFTGQGSPYPGQITAILNGTNQPDIYVIWEVPSGTAGAIQNQLNTLFYAYSPISAAAEGITLGSMTPPANPQPGDIWSRPDNRLLFRLDSGAWVQLFPFDGGGP